MDASNSMNSRWGTETRIQSAKELLAATVDSLKDVPNLEIALRVYGHQSPITATYQDCNDTKLEVPFLPNNFDKVKYRIKSIQAKGTTPIARSLEAAADDFPDQTTRNVIILITDGLEACDNDPCVIAQKLKDKGVTITPFVIGLGLDLSYLEKFNCIGNYSEAETKDAFKNVLKNVVSKAVLNTTVQINLNDIQNAPKETNVTLFLYKAGTKQLIYTYIHTINKFGNPDTLNIDPKMNYDLVVNTIPKIEKKGIILQKNTHNIIVVDAPQGYLKCRLLYSNRPYSVETRVILIGDDKTINVQQINSTDKYIVGKYKVEILTLPRIYKEVEISQSSTTTIDIEAPGSFSYKTGREIVGQIFIKKDDGTFDWVCNLDLTAKSGQWYLQPGSYKVAYRHKDGRSASQTVETEIRIYSNKTTSVNL
ncbi:VWA domain-containing protein [Crocinitomicaceae bacterium]|nr:VWA domain-containing protein [Crocinitomicaceae bacterium]